MNLVKDICPELRKEWHPTRNTGIIFDELRVRSGKQVWWLCSKNPKHEWPARVRNRAIEKNGCPYCSGRKVLREESFAALFPKMAAEWHPTKNGSLDPWAIVNDQGQDRDQMELWFDRAMENNTNDYEACQAKLNYLEPKWYGSTEAMLEFGRECATNQAWGGHVPLILLDAHKSIQRQYVNDSGKNDYWKQPEVWADIKTAFDRFFQLNPDAIGWYHDYAWYAYQAGQWDTLNKIIPKLGPINYNFFGGTNEFDKMVQLAKEHAGNPK